MIHIVAFLGGAILGLLFTDPAAREARPTEDVDLVILTLRDGFKVGYKKIIDHLALVQRRGAKIEVLPLAKIKAGMTLSVWFADKPTNIKG